jgi:hypothetical protein
MVGAMWRLKHALTSVAMLLGLAGCNPGSGIRITFEMNSVETIVRSAIELVNQDPGRSAQAQQNLETAANGLMGARRPCSMLVTLRNESRSRKPFDPAALRLEVLGQTFAPVRYSLPGALPLTPLVFAPGEVRSGTVVFMPTIAVANAADSATGKVRVIYDRAAARRR